MLSTLKPCILLLNFTSECSLFVYDVYLCLSFYFINMPQNVNTIYEVRDVIMGTITDNIIIMIIIDVVVIVIILISHYYIIKFSRNDNHTLDTFL